MSCWVFISGQAICLKLSVRAPFCFWKLRRCQADKFCARTEFAGLDGQFRIENEIWIFFFKDLTKVLRHWSLWKMIFKFPSFYSWPMGHSTACHIHQSSEVGKKCWRRRTGFAEFEKFFDRFLLLSAEQNSQIFHVILCPVKLWKIPFDSSWKVLQKRFWVQDDRTGGSVR